MMDDGGRPVETGGVSPQALAEKVLDLLRPLARGAGRYALLDFPAHNNVGDSAIWLGEVTLLGRLHGRGPQLVSHTRYPPGQAGKVLPPGDKGLIYLHGGGNFGDLWPHYQLYREAVIAANREHRIVQLPQSIHYQDETGVERVKRAIGQHPDFHLMVRDKESADFADLHFDCPVILAPDSAFGIDMTNVPRNPMPRGIAAHLRDDKEQRPDAGAAHALFADATVFDWPREGRRSRLLQKAALGAFLVVPPALSGSLPEKTFTALARRRVMRGLGLLDAAEVVVTDRLHGHILCSLLGKPHVVVDNFYGKIRRFIAAWGADDLTSMAGDYVEARHLAEGLRAGKA